MKSDIDRLMSERGLDAILVEGPDGLGGANPDFNYFTGGQHLTGLVLKKRGEPAMLLHSAWEQVQARATGLVLVSKERWNLRDILKQTPDLLAAGVEYRRQVFADLGVTGRVGVYGTVDSGRHLALLRGLEKAAPGLEFVAEYEKDLLSTARLTKEPAEIDALRDVGRRTCAVVRAVVDHLRAGRPGGSDGGVLVDSAGGEMTIGRVKALIRRELAGQGLEDPSGPIFAQGRDAGLPHATGDDASPLRLGQSIVFDIFPRQQGGGYFHDMTRTFCLAYAPPAVQKAYDDVREAFEQAVAGFKVGAPAKPFQDDACRFFESRGHETILSKYPIEEGYVHSLGHGLGLGLHEDFGFPALKDRGDVLQRGAVFTVEPGLYYPSRGFGIRIEDTYVCTAEGKFESLTPFPKELVIPLA